MTLSFGIQFEPQFGFNKEEVELIAKDILHSQYFDTIWISDHFFLDTDATNKSSFDAWTLMTYLLAKVEQIRVGSLVLCNSYHNPSILAKKVATLDQLSKGRLELGYGAGWKEIEYNAYGIEFPPTKVRIDQFEEGIQILLRMWSEDPKSNFNGKYYKIKEAICYPKPYQKPLPLWIGSMTGRNRMLRLAAKYAFGLNLAWAFDLEKCEIIFKKLNQFAKEYKRDPSDIKRSLGFWVKIYESEEQMEIDFQKEAQKRNISVKKYKQRIDGALVGTKNQIIEKLCNYINIGVSHFIFMFPYQKEKDYIRIFNSEILSQLK